jgi:hypothetical protein
MLRFADAVGLFYSSAAQAASGLWTSFSGTIHTSGLPAGNVGSTAASFGPNSGSITVPTAAGPYTFGMRFVSTNAYGSDQEICRFYDASNNQQVTFATNSGGTVTAYRGAFHGTVLGVSSGTTMTQSVWDYIEFQVTVSATVGTVSVRINGALVLNLTGVNTLGGGGAAVIGKIAIGSNQANFVQDVYCTDSTGSHNVGFLGDVHVSGYSAAGAGTAGLNQYTPNGAATVWQSVAAATPADSTIFASDATPGDRMSVTVAPTSVTGTIAGVVHVSRLLKNNSGTRTASQTVTSNSVDAIATAINLGTSYQYATQILETDPNTGIPWTVTGFNAAQCGVETVS